MPDAGAVRWMLSTLSSRLQRTDETDAEFIAVADRLVLLAGKGELYGQVADRAQSHLNYDRAIQLLEKRVDLTPNNPTAHRALGTAYINDGREDAGYAELVMALLLDPDGADTLAALGRVHLAAGRYTAAAEALQKAIALKPSDGEALQALGDALVHDGKVEEGHRRIEEAARAQAAAVEEQRRLRTFGMRGSQATLSVQQGDYERAIALRQQVIELDPGNAGHYLRLADTLVRAKRLGDAETQLRTAISLGAAQRRIAVWPRSWPGSVGVSRVRSSVSNIATCACRSFVRAPAARDNGATEGTGSQEQRRKRRRTEGQPFDWSACGARRQPQCTGTQMQAAYGRTRGLHLHSLTARQAARLRRPIERPSLQKSLFVSFVVQDSVVSSLELCQLTIQLRTTNYELKGPGAACRDAGPSCWVRLTGHYAFVNFVFVNFDLLRAFVFRSPP